MFPVNLRAIGGPPPKTRSGGSSACVLRAKFSKSKSSAKSHADQNAAKYLQTSTDPQESARKGSANSFGFISWPRRCPPRSNRTPPSILRRGGIVLMPSGSRPPETAPDRRSRDLLSSCPRKSAGSVQASLTLKRIANLHQVLLANSPASGSLPKSTFSLGAIEPRRPLICGSG